MMYPLAISIAKGYFYKGRTIVDVYKECLHYQHKIEGKDSRFQRISMLFRQKICRRFDVPYIECFITTKCNIKCKHCSNLIPYIEKRKHMPFVDLKRDLDTFLAQIDRLYRLKIHGGEVFLHPELCDIIVYADGLKKLNPSALLRTGRFFLPKKFWKPWQKAKWLYRSATILFFPGKKNKR